MIHPTKIRKAPMFVGLSAFGGAGVGALAGGVAGVIVLLILVIFGSDNGAAEEASQYSGFVWTSLMFGFALLLGGTLGIVPGAIGGFLLGLLFCFVRNRWMGVVGGALFGALTAVYVGNSWPALDANALFITWLLVGLGIAGGALAGALLTRLLFHLINQESQRAA